jgi:hypothetical protein
MGLAALAGGLAFVGSAEAVELVIDGGFENTADAPGFTTVGIGGLTHPGVNGGWSIFSTYKYSTSYTMPLTNGIGANIGGAQFLRPYPAGAYGVNNSSQTVTQLVSLTATTTLTPAKIDAGLGAFTMSAWFSTYLNQNDYSDLTLTFQDTSGAVVGSPVALGGSTFVANLDSGDNGRYLNARFWGHDSQGATIPVGARFAKVLIHATALVGLGADGYVDLVSLNVVDLSTTTPVLASANPPDNAVSVGPVVTIDVQLQDRLTAVNTNSIRMYLDGLQVAPIIQKPDTNTTIHYVAGLLPSLSPHTYAVAFSDNGVPVATQSNYFRFTVASYLSLPPSLASPLGSEDPTKPGFNVNVYQVDTLVDPAATNVNIPDSIGFDESLLAGLAGPNVGDLSTAASGNAFVVPTVAHWANSSGTTPNFPNPDTFPGIPGTTFSEDNFVDDIRTFVRFPTSGYYQMGVNNNDNLRLSAGNMGVLTLKLVAPTNTAIPCVPIATNITQLLFGGALPFAPLTTPVVYATPSGNPDDSCNVSTNTSLAGKIALLDLGSTNCTSADDAYQAQLAGAVAVLATTPGDTGFPSRLGNNDPRVTIPVLVIGENYGGLLLKSFLTNRVAVTATILGDAAPRVAEWDGPKGFGNVDVLAGFGVPAAGVYPLRLVAGHANGAADLEWFSIMPNGTRILVNDTTNPNALLAFRARNAGAAPVLSSQAVSGGSVRISWTGIGMLEVADSIQGPWYTAPDQSNPQSVPHNGQMKFFRVRHF